MMDRDQAYWNENCDGDPTACLGCYRWGGDGICAGPDDFDEMKQSIKLIPNDGVKRVCFICDKEIDRDPKIIMELSNQIFACYRHEGCDLETLK